MSKKNEGTYPDYNSIVKQINFDKKTGRVWLGESQMLFLDITFFCDLRQVLIDIMGINGARGVLTRLGYLAGFKHARLTEKLRKDYSDKEAYLIGPQLSMVSGVASVEVITLEVDVAQGKFHGEFLIDSLESESYNYEHDSACWYLAGYASGFTSGFMGRQILVVETKSSATTNRDRCIFIAKPIDEWENVEKELAYYEPLNLSEQLFELQSQVAGLRNQLEKSSQPILSPETVGASQSFCRTFTLIEKAAPSKVSILLLGETGVGKEKFARAAHNMSPRSEQPFIAINCAAIPATLLEAELFGVNAGAYTGADKSRAGHFERANNGTLFLDEIGELSPQAQASLLRVLQEGELMRVGGEKTTKVDVRLIAATNRDLKHEVDEGRFRADLYYRLNVYPVTIPPLRERIEDIPLLSEHFLEKFSAIHNKRFSGISDRATMMLKQHPWPGNVRELENMVERGVILADNHSVIEVTDLFVNAEMLISDQDLLSDDKLDESQWANRLLDSGCELESLEEKLITKAMERASNNVASAARLLGISRPTLAYKLKKLNETTLIHQH
jgi:transcriptional regulator with PAS, ATPase and Fis domain